MREARGMSQEELAAAVGMKKAAISKYERGRAHPTIDRLRQMAKVLECRVTDLIDDEHEDPKADKMLQLFHDLPPDQQDAMIRLATTMAEPARNAGSPTDRKRNSG